MTHCAVALPTPMARRDCQPGVFGLLWGLVFGVLADALTYKVTEIRAAIRTSKYDPLKIIIGHLLYIYEAN
jgi:hypothetical protein